jgi:hypothetical protein
VIGDVDQVGLGVVGDVVRDLGVEIAVAVVQVAEPHHVRAAARAD